MSPGRRSIELRLKRLIDITVALVVLVVTAPVVAVAALLVLAQFGSPVFFRQERTGRYERRIRVLKLRTMSDDRDAEGRLLPDGVRCRGVGRTLRRLSIDELPQLVNVLRGDLSLVGPRPLLLRYDPWYTDRERKRFEVRPGITGLAQVNGRNDLAWTERLELDVRYVLDWSLWLDLRILARTAGKVLRASGVAVDPSAQMLDLDQERRLTGVR
ncbi:sugar transferase [Micromonospora sp. BL1]|uniref:sugar transferase n=1 Tax=Micromonospora sp. BL1 TaxID=2478709 RepID=UPI000EF5A764|nr:sugar transferase [Micromonospora sp. BL1]RLQ06152.1 sugar transferase [Micromonospora sp. BL1]